ncbi:MAG: tryptophan synthase subunit alpha [Gemmatimonadota bacterium]
MISRTFAARAAQGQSTLVPYVTAGYPEAESTVPLLKALVEAGADVLEVGIPFSDPLADGPTIQRSSFASLRNGTTVRRVLDDVATFRSRHETPVVLFTYLNPILRYGVETFVKDALAAGAQGLLMTDLPAGSDPDVEQIIIDSALDLIRLVAPTTGLDRMPGAVAGGSGFVYYISRTGVTGASADLSGTLGDEVRRLKSIVSMPVAVGFGISTPEQARAVAEVADGVVVGSALIQALDASGISGAAKFIESLRQGMDG